MPLSLTLLEIYLCSSYLFLNSYIFDYSLPFYSVCHSGDDRTCARHRINRHGTDGIGVLGCAVLKGLQEILLHKGLF